MTLEPTSSSETSCFPDASTEGAEGAGARDGMDRHAALGLLGTVGFGFASNVSFFRVVNLQFSCIVEMDVELGAGGRVDDILHAQFCLRRRILPPHNENIFKINKL